MARVLVFALALLAARPASGADLDQRWGLMQGLMAGITVAHAVQPLAVAMGDLEWRNKHAVAIAGTALYGTTFVGHLFRSDWSLYVAIVGPIVGFTTVVGAFVLDTAGVTELGIRPDSFQLAGATLQVPAAIIAWGMLRDQRVAVLPSPRGLTVAVRLR